MLSNGTNRPKSTAELGYMCSRGLLGPPSNACTIYTKLQRHRVISENVCYWSWLLTTCTKKEVSRNKDFFSYLVRRKAQLESHRGWPLTFVLNNKHVVFFYLACVQSKVRNLYIETIQSYCTSKCPSNESQWPWPSHNNPQPSWGFSFTDTVPLRICCTVRQTE